MKKKNYYLKSWLLMLVMLLGVGNAAWADNYVKVTSTTDLTDGQYLIVYEDGNIALNGGLETLDKTDNWISVTINDGVIASTTNTDAATFTYNATAKTLKSASGFYIGQSKNDNGLLSSSTDTYENVITFDNSGNANIVSGGAYLRYNSASNQTRFRYYKSSSYSNQKAIQLYKLTGSGATTAEQTTTTINSDGITNTDIINGTSAGTLVASVTDASGSEISGASVAWSSLNTSVATIDEEGSVTLVGEGEAEIVATYFGEDGQYKGSTASYKFTVTDSRYETVTFVAGTDKGESSVTKAGVTVSMSTMNRDDNYRTNSATSMTVSTTKGNITNIEITCTGTGTNNYGPGKFSGSGYTSSTGNIGTWVGSSNSVSLAASAQVRMTQIVVKYLKSNKTDVTLSFPQETYEATYGTDFDAPTVTAEPEVTGIKYSSSKTAVATVDENTGVVTLNAAGETIITATFAGNDDYNAGSASYTLTVNPATVVEESDWVKVNLTDLTADDIFVIVGNNGDNYALSNNNGTGNPPSAVEVSINGDYLTGEVANTIKWTVSGNAADGYTFYPSGSTTTWLYCISNNNGLRVGNGDNKVFVINDDYLYNSGQSRYIGIYNSQDWRSYTSINTNIANQEFAFYKFVGSIPVKAPTFTPAAGTIFEAQNVTISCETEGATIYYTTDGTDPTNGSTEYTGAITISQTTTLNAIAYKDGEASAVATATYTIAPSYGNCNAANEAATKDRIVSRVSFTDALVTYVNGSNAYIQDATGGFLIFGNTDLTVGDKITGYVQGELYLYNGLPEITNPTLSVTTVSSDNEVTPIVVDAADLKANPLNYVSQYVVVKPATFKADNFSNKNVTFTVNEDEFVLRNQFDTGVTFNTEDKYKVAGFVAIYNDAVQLYPTKEEDVVMIPMVAQIDNVKYETLAEAVSAAQANDVIIMIADETINTNAGVTIPADKNVVLDLNGKTIKGVVQSAASAQTILNKGTLVITDSSDEKTGTITNEVSDENAGSPGDGKNWFSNAITNTGTLTVNAGNIVNTGTGGACYAIDNQTNGNLQTPVLNIAGGNISAVKVAVRMFCNSTTNDNTVNVTGGVISSENAYAIQTQMANKNANKATLNISGGYLSGEYAWADYGDKNTATQFDNTTYRITGGYFSGYMWSYATYYCGMEGFISGGYFNNVVGGDLVAPGSACVDNTDEATKETYPYTTGMADVHYYWLDNNGNIDGGGYYTIYAPFEGPDPVLMDGEFVVLQKNVTLTKDIEYIEECDFGNPIYKGGTFTLTFGEYNIDLNGHKFPLPTGVTVLTDKQTNIFSAAEEGYTIVETTTETGYSYTTIIPVAKIGEALYASLQAALDAAHEMEGDVTVELIDNIEGYAIIHQKAGLNLTIDGAGKTVAGQIIIDGDGRASGTETLTIQNVKFEGNSTNFYTGTDAFILIPSTKETDKPYTTGGYNYAHNVTISNCSFTSTSANASGFDVVGIKATSGAGAYNIVITESTGTNLHSLAQLTGTTGATVENNTVTLGESFLNVNGGAGTFTVSGNIFTAAEGAAGYGVRENGSSSATINLTANDFTAASAIVLGKGSNATAGTINVESGVYNGVISKTEAATGKIVISGGYFSEEIPQEFIVEGKVCVAAADKPGYFTIGDPTYVAQIGDVKYTSLQAAVDAAHEMEGDVTVELIDNIEGYAIVHQKAGLNLTIDGAGKTVAGQIIIDGDGRASGTETLTIQNVKFEGNTSNFYSGTDAFILVPSCKTSGTPYYTNKYNYAHNITVKDCSFISTSTSEEYDVVGIKATSGAGLYNVVINNCTASGTMMHSLAQLTGTTGGTVTNCTVTGSESFVNVNGGTGEFTISGNTFTSDENASEGYGIRENGTSTAVITLTDNNFTAANAVLLGKTTAVTAGTINVESGVYNGVISKTEAATGKIVISGGYFSEEVAQEFIVEGKVCVAAADKPGYFTIGDPIYVSNPVIFHDAGEYEGELTVAMAAQEGATIKYTVNGGNEQTYAGPITVSSTTTIKAWAELLGAKSGEVEKTFTIVPKETSDIDLSGYYTIQTNEGKYMNVAGRKTVTLNDDTKSAGTVLKVEVEDGQVQVLRSQGIDLPAYAEKTINYVPDLVKAIIKKLGENGVENNVIGEPGADKVVEEFMNKFDYHLYLEQPEGSEGYRIYGKTPSMSLVVDFYAQNKEVIDGRLPYLEDFVKNVFQKVVEVTGHGGSFIDSFKIHDIWTKMKTEDPKLELTEPVDGDEVAISKFYTEVLSSEKNVWNFAHNTAMIYWDRVESYLNGGDNEFGDLGDYSKYISRIRNIQPNFKYYLVPDASSGVDIISEGNEAILTNAASAAWTLNPRSEFDVTLPVEKAVTIYPTSSTGETISSTEYYGTLYTDFAYDLPEGVTAYKVEGINTIKNKSGVTTAVLVKKSELKVTTIPAQTPVLLMANKANLTLTLNTDEGSAVESELHGTDWLINEYEINSPTAEGIFTIIAKLSESLAEQYEYLKRRNSGTVNNKYFFGIAIEGDFDKAYKAKTGQTMESCPVRVLSTNDDGKVAFIETWNPLANNEGFMFSEEYSEILLSMPGDVNRDGQVSIADVTALVNIILGKATYPADAGKYDFEAANVNGDGQISIADVTSLVNIILGK